MKPEPGDSSHGLRNNFLRFLVASLLSMLFMRSYADGLSSRVIIDFELAKTVSQVQQMMTSWGPTGMLQMQKSIYADFLFLLCYTFTLYFGARYMGQLSRHFIFRKASVFFSALALIAGCCDIIENAAMLHTLQGTPMVAFVHLTYDMALIKFSLIMIVLLFMFSNMLYWGIERLTEEKWGSAAIKK